MMKKLLISFLGLIAFVLPTIAQVDHDYNINDRVPVVTATLTPAQIPAAIIKAVNTEFSMNKTISYYKFPYVLKEYGFVYDVGASDLKPDRYEVTMKTTNGEDLEAVYSAEGNLISSREMSTNVPLPSSVKEALSNSQYKDWTVVGEKEIIRYYHDRNNVEQHFRITVEKDNVKRSISFNYQMAGNK